MAATPIYSFPYPGLSDPPHGPNNMQALALAVETKTADVDADIATINALLAGVDVPTQTGSGALAPGDATIMSYTIPDPGFSFRVFVQGSIGWAVATATQPNLLFSASITIDSPVFSTNEIVRGYSMSGSVGANFSQATAVTALKRHPTVLTGGAHIIRLIAHNFSGINYTIPAAAIDTTLHVRIVPV